MQKKFLGDQQRRDLSPKEFIIDLCKEKLKKKSRDLDNSIQIIIKQSKRDTRFIDEMIQNADDANADKIVFTLKEKSIIIKNNGREFNRNDVYSICSIDSSKTEKATIGVFGVGFKSIFRITLEPSIKSGFYHFYIRDYLYPSWIDDNGFLKGALFEAPFEESFLTKINEVSSKLGTLNPQMLLFLENLKEIKIEDNITGSSIYYRCEVRDEIKTINFSFKNFCIHEYSTKNKEEWIVFCRNVEIPDHLEEYKAVFQRILKKRYLQINLAFKKSEFKLLKNLEHTDLFVFLPVHETNFSFLLNADFITTSSRDDLDENEWNKFLLEKTAEFYFEITKFCVKNRPFGFDLYKFIPTKDQIARNFLNYFQEEIVRQLTTEPTIPLRNLSSWVSSDVIFFPSDPQLYELVIDKDIQDLFPGYCGFVHPSLQQNIPIFEELDIRVFDIDDLLKALLKYPEFHNSKNNTWWIKLFSYLSDFEDKNPYWDSSIFEKLCRNYNIVQTIEENEILSSDGSEFPIFYLNKKDLSRRKEIYSLIRKQEFGTFIHELFYEYAEEEFTEEIKDNSQSKLFGFLENYDLVHTFNRSNVIKYGIVARLKQLNPQLNEDFRLIHKIWKAIFNQWSEDIKSFNPENLSNHSIFPSIDSENIILRPINRCYIRYDNGSTALWDIFNGIEGIFFEVDIGIKPREKWEEFLKLAGIRSTIIVETKNWKGSEWTLKERGICISSKKYNELRHSPVKGFQIQSDKQSVHIEKLFSIIPKFPLEIQKEKLISLIRHLSDYWDEYHRHLESELKWHYYGWYYEDVDTLFAKTLKERNWVPIEGNLYSPKGLILRNMVLTGIKVSDNLIFPIEIAEEMADDLGVRKHINIQILLNILHDEIVKDSPDVERINLLLEQLNKAYLYEGESIQTIDEINQFLKDLPIINVRNQYYTIANTFVSDYSRFFGTDRAYLENNYSEPLQIFFQKIGVKVSPSLTNLVEYLREIAAKFQYGKQLDKQVQMQLWRIIKSLHENKGYLKLPKELLIDLKVPTHSQGFLHCHDVFYNDNEELSEIFKDDLPFFINIKQHKSILDLFEWCGLNAISKSVTIKISVINSNFSSSEIKHTILSSLRALKIIQEVHKTELGELIKEDLSKLEILFTKQTLVEYILYTPSRDEILSYTVDKDVVVSKDLKMYINECLVSNGVKWTELALVLSNYNNTPSLICSFELLFQKAKGSNLIGYLKSLNVPVDEKEAESLTETLDKELIKPNEITESETTLFDDEIITSDIEETPITENSIIYDNVSKEEFPRILENDIKIISQELTEPQVESDPSTSITVRYTTKEIDEPKDLSSETATTAPMEGGISHSRQETEDFGTILVKKFEESNNRHFFDLRKKSGLGYDFYSKNKEGEIERRIEMKALSKKSSTVSLTIRELSAMQKYRDGYFLYIIENTWEEPILSVLRNPALYFKTVFAEHVVLKDWKKARTEKVEFTL